MANDIPAGKSAKKPPTSKQSTPGASESGNSLPSTAKVFKSAKSNLMTGSSQNRGPGGTK